MPAVSGWAGRVQVGGLGQVVILPAVRWLVVSTTELVDVTYVGTPEGGTLPCLTLPASPTSDSGRVHNYINGYSDVAVTVDVLWDTSVTPFSSSIRKQLLQSGNVVGVTLFIDRSSPTARFDLQIRLETTTFEQEVRGVSKYTITGKQSGNLLGGVPQTPYSGGTTSTYGVAPGVANN